MTSLARLWPPRTIYPNECKYRPTLSILNFLFMVYVVHPKEKPIFKRKETDPLPVLQKKSGQTAPNFVALTLPILPKRAYNIYGKLS